jgi:hypothetical protein
MNRLLRPPIWPSFLASSGVPSTSSGQAHPATYYSSTPRNQPPVVARWYDHLGGLATAIHEVSGLPRVAVDFVSKKEKRDSTQTIRTILMSSGEQKQSPCHGEQINYYPGVCLGLRQQQNFVEFYPSRQYSKGQQVAKSFSFWLLSEVQQ